MRTRRTDLERALGVGLTANVSEVELVGCARRCRCRRRQRRDVGVAVEQTDRVAQRERSEHVKPVDRARLDAILDGDQERVDLLPSAREPDREHAADGLDLAVERQLSHDCEPTDAIALDRAGGGEDAERDRQIERGAFLPQVGRRQIHRDSIVGKGKPGVANRSPHAFAALAHRRVREPDGGERGEPRRHVDLDADERSLDADEGRGQDAREHETIVRSDRPRVNVAVRRRRRYGAAVAELSTHGAAPALIDRC